MELTGAFLGSIDQCQRNLYDDFIFTFTRVSINDSARGASS